MTDQRLADLLSLWHAWLRQDDHGLGYPSKAAGIGYCQSLDFETMCDSADHHLVLIVDATVSSLPDLERAAVAVVVLGDRWRWPRISPDRVYADSARPMMVAGLHRRGVE